MLRGVGQGRDGTACAGGALPLENEDVFARLDKSHIVQHKTGRKEKATGGLAAGNPARPRCHRFIDAQCVLILPLPGFPGDNLLVIFMRLTEKLVFPHGNDESAPSILMGWRAAATSFEPQLALPPVATRNGPAQPMRIGAGTASEETAKLEASGWGWVHRCFRSIKFPPEIPEEPVNLASQPKHA